MSYSNMARCEKRVETCDKKIQTCSVIIGKMFKEEVVNKAINSRGLLPRIDQNGKITYVAKVTGVDFTQSSIEFSYFHCMKHQEPYRFPSDEIMQRWFEPDGGWTSVGLSEESDYIIDTVYDQELEMALPSGLATAEITCAALELGQSFLLLKQRHWYEVEDNEINFVVDQDGRVSKIRASNIFQLDLPQFNLVLLLKQKKDEKALDKVLSDMKLRKNTAMTKFKKKVLMLRSGGEDALATYNELCQFFGKPDGIL